VLELPVNVTDVFVQVILPPIPEEPGAVVFDATMAVAVETQPLTGLATVKL
jgi:hypothetical protein